MSKAKRTYIIIALLFSSLSLTALVAEAVSYAMLSDIQSSTAEKKYYNEKLAEKEQILSNLSDSYNDISEFEGLILETLPEDKEASKLIADINSIAIKANLKFTNVESIASEAPTKTAPSKIDSSLLQTIKGKNGYEMPLSIKVEGSYSNIISFVEGIENYQRLVGIDDIEIEKKDDENVNDYVEATLDITAYLKR